MNIEDHLEDITHMTGVNADDHDSDDIELQKCNILYNEGKGAQNYDVYDPFAHSELVMQEPLNLDTYLIDSGSTTAAASPALTEIKKEPEWEKGRPTHSCRLVPCSL